MKKKCDGCKYWSELVAQSIGCSPIKALCLNFGSDYYNKMVSNGCEDREEGTPIDQPY